MVTPMPAAAESASNTWFAPAERLPREEVELQARQVKSQPGLLELLDSFPDVLMVLNECRQILFINQALVSYLGHLQGQDLLGMRPGEVLGCIHSQEQEGGCGTSEACRLCGAVRCLLNSIKGQMSVADCRVNRRLENGQEEALNLRVWCAPLTSLQTKVIVFCLTDSSHEHRLATLERLFFHDVLNTVGGLQGYAESLRDYELPEDARDTAAMIFQLAEFLTDQIRYQQEMLLAERNELAVEPVWLNSAEFLGQILEKSQRLDAARRKALIQADDMQPINLFTDPVILERVLGNMIKNALEATPSNGTVTVGCRSLQEGVQFWVHNPTDMPRDVQLQVFQRAFSTKGKGRGFGTYGVKLLTERYLQGGIGFESAETQGTTFWVSLPIELNH